MDVISQAYSKIRPFQPSAPPSDCLKIARVQYESAREELNVFEPTLTFHGKHIVLDLGCGLGGNTVYYAKAGARRVIGLEINPTRAKCAKKFVRKTKSDGEVDIVIGDAENLPFLGEAIDCVISTDSWEHLQNPEKAIYECSRVLRTGGRVAIKAMPYYSPWGAHAWQWFPVPWIPSLLPRRLLCRILSIVEDFMKVNKYLPEEVRIDWSCPDDAAHARGLTVSRMICALPIVGTRTEYYRLIPIDFRLKGRIKGLGQFLTRSPITREFFTGIVVVVIQKL